MEVLANGEKWSDFVTDFISFLQKYQKPIKVLNSIHDTLLHQAFLRNGFTPEGHVFSRGVTFLTEKNKYKESVIFQSYSAGDLDFV